MTSCKVQSYSKKELCQLYKVSTVTFRKWIQHLAIEGKINVSKRIFTPKEVKIIFEEIGEPN
jgi:DeoR/GlpR family transcriptional regulator of sugar metabolism